VADRPTANDRDGVAPLRAGDFSAGPRRAAVDQASGQLHLCRRCDSDLVYPVDWSPANDREWNVDLRCPECEWRGSGVHAQDTVDRFDEQLDRGTEQLLRDLSALTRANMGEEVERFVTALHAGWVVPEDF